MISGLTLACIIRENPCAQFRILVLLSRRVIIIVCSNDNMVQKTGPDSQGTSSDSISAGSYCNETVLLVGEFRSDHSHFIARS